MTIEITKSGYTQVCAGPDWALYSVVSFKDTAIIWELYGFVKESKDVPYSKIAEILKQKKRESKAKSDCMIFDSENMVEVTKPRGGFPRFYILKIFGNQSKSIIK